MTRVEPDDVIEKILKVYVEERIEDERFLDTYRRIGMEPFKDRVYEDSQEAAVEEQAVASN